MSALDKPRSNLRLKREREQRGWSQEKLADLIGTTQKIVSRWERGGSVPLPYYREKLCTVFGKDAAELGLLGESPEEERSAALTQSNSPDLTWPDPLLTLYLQRQRTRMLNTLAPGSTDLWVRDIVGKDGLFLTPPWIRVQGSTPPTTLVPRDAQRDAKEGGKMI
jgi:transcriptional regulator with XRE-family HTH domain